MQLIFSEGLRLKEPDMIIADASEMRYLTDLKEVSEIPITISSDLEELTGADMMITTLSIPVAAMTLPEHLDSGAILIQIKRGDDLVASAGDRAASSLARMINCGTTAAWQRVLLYVGTLNFDAETGAAVVNGRPNTRMGPHTYWSVQGTIEKWIERGGAFTSIARMSMLESWLNIKMSHLVEFSHNPSRTVLKDRPDMFDPQMELVQGFPLQALVLVKDWRNTLVSIPGIGVSKAQAIYDFVQNKCAEKTLLTALMCLTTEELAVKIPGIGKGLSSKARQWFGIDDVFQLSIEVKEKAIQDG